MNHVLPTNWQVRSKSGYWKEEKGVIWYIVGKKTGSNNKIQDYTSSAEIFVIFWELELELNRQKATRRERKNWHSSQYKWCLVILNQSMEDFSLDTLFGLQQQGWWWRRKITLNIVASSPDTNVEVVRKYKKAKPNLIGLTGLGADVWHGVDTTQMKFHPYLKMRRFDRIIFNFPHATWQRR